MPIDLKVEYKVRAVTRFIVTRYGEEDGGRIGPPTQHGTFDDAETAYHVAYALCKAEHDRRGDPLDSLNFIYPKVPDGVPCAGQ